MNYTLKELLDVPRLNQLLDSLDELHSMPSAILDTEGTILTATAWQDICTKFHRINPDTAKKCSESDRHIEARLGVRDPHVIYRCPMGLVDAAMPIIIEGKHLGNVFTGQLFMEAPDEEYFINQARTYGFDETEYLEAMRKVPFFAEEKLHKNLNFIHGLTQMLAEQGLQNKRLLDAERLEQYRTNILEMLAADNPLTNILEAIVTGVEQLHGSMLCSILLLDAEGRHLCLGAAPSLPDFYNAAIDGIEIGMGVGSCGTAAFTGERVIVDDIATHHYWAPYKELAAEAGLAACWSEPIRSASGKILGTFAIYHHQPSKLTDADTLLVEHSSHLASIAIEKMAAAENAVASEQRHRIILQTAMSGFWLADMQGHLVEVNNAYCHMSGYSEQELLGMSIPDLEAVESTEDTAATIKKILDQGEARFESRHRRKDGTLFDVEVNVQYQSVDGGRCVAFLHDITERKRAEAALLEHADFTMRVFNSTDAHLAVVDQQGIIQDINDAWRSFARANLSEDESAWGVGANYFVKYDENWGDAELADEAFEGVCKVQNGQLPSFELEYPCHGPDNQKRWFHLIVFPLKGREGSVIVAHSDITTSKLAEIANTILLMRQRSILDNLPMLAWLKDTESRLEMVNESYAKAYGCSVEECIGKTDLELFPQEMAKAYMADDQEVCITGHSKRVEEQISTPDGVIWHLTYKTPLFDEKGLVVGTTGIAQDITERKLAEAYRLITAEILQILNEPGDLQDVAQHVLTILMKHTGFDAVGLRLQEGDDFPYLFQDGFSRDFLLTENSLIEVATDGGVCRDDCGNVCLECTCGLVISGKIDSDNPLFSKGGSFWTNNSSPLLDIPFEEDPRLHPRNRCIHDGYASVALVPIRNKERIVGLIQFNDRRKGCFTIETVEHLEEIAAHLGAALMRRRAEEEKLALEKQFQKAQKLESLGVLASGIAHDFNNILAVIFGHCSLATIHPASADKHIPVIEQAAGRAAELCRQMLTYAGQDKNVQALVDLGALVDEMVTMLRSTISKNVSIKLERTSDLPCFMGDASQIRQVVMNMIINAADSIGDDQGEIRVSLTTSLINASKSEKDHQGFPIETGRYDLLEITDTGCGMNDEVRQRIFEPFYTTKFTGRGLGMSAVLGIIKTHNGALQLFSQEGQGTTFKVYLPVQNSESSADEPLQNFDVAPWQGSGTILLVEDEELISQVAKAMLEELGFIVITASNGKEALEQYRIHNADIRLVMTDMGMPVMDGYDLFRELKVINPEMPIVISSGFGDTAVTGRIPREDIAGLVSKPYRFDELRMVIKSVTENALLCEKNRR